MKKLLLLMTILLVLPTVLAEPHDCSDPDVICDHLEVGQEAEVGAGGGNPPTMEYVWVLPDEDPLEPGTQLFPKLSDQRNDIYACIVTSDPQGRDDVQQVFVDVFHPSGTGPLLPCVEEAGIVCNFDENPPFDKDETQTGLFKYQVHADRLDVVDDREEIEDCKLDALNAGLISQNDFDLINYNIFSQPEWYMWKVYLPMLYHQPAGWYSVEAWGTDTASDVSDRLTTSFEWVSTVAMEIDFFDGLDYGYLQPSVYKVIQGDYNLVDGDGKPTVKNEGNERVNISLSSTSLGGQQFGKQITDFDVKWDPYEVGFGYGQIFFQADQTVKLADPLELCQTEKIDFSIHADVGLPADVYDGTMSIWTEVFEGNQIGPFIV
jgi:hypothetical protein